MFTVVALTLVMPATFLISDSSQAVEPISLGVADDFAILAGAGITNAGETNVLGHIGSNPTVTVTGQATITQTGSLHLGDDTSIQAKSDLQAAFDAASALTSTNTIAGNLGGLTLSPGVYTSAATIAITGNLILDAGGDANAVFVFQAGSTLDVAASSEITLINGGSLDHVYWKVGSTANIAANAKLLGTVLAQTTIAMAAGSSVRGRLLAINGSVTLSSNNVHKYDPPIVTLTASTIDLATAAGYAVLAGGGITNAGETNVLGHIGTNPTATLTGQASITQTGEVHLADAAAIQAKTDLQAAYDSAKSVSVVSPISGDLIGMTITPGAYESVGAISLTGNLVLDAGGDANAVFLFRVEGALNVAAGGNVTVINGGSADNVYWRVTGAANLAAGSSFMGTALVKTAIAVAAGASVRGRLLAIGGTVTLSNNNVYSYDAPVVTLSTSTIDLATAGTYAILAGTGITNAAGVSSVLGDIGSNPAATFTGQDTLTQTGNLHLADAAAVQAKVDLQVAYDAAKSVSTTTPISGDLIGLTLTAGAYKSAGALSLTGNLIFDAEGNSDAMFLIQVSGALNVAAGGNVTVINGGNIGNVFWQVTGATNLAAGSVFAGTVLAKDAINVAAGATVTGRLLALGGTVALSSNSVTRVDSSLELAAIAAAAQAVQDALDAEAAALAAAAQAAQDALDAADAASRAADAADAASRSSDAADAADAASRAAAIAAAAQDALDLDLAALEAADALAASEAADALAASEAADAVAAEAAQVQQKAVAAEAEEVRVYGPKSVMTFAPSPNLLDIEITPVLKNVVLQIAVVPAGPIAGGDASRAAQY